MKSLGKFLHTTPQGLAILKPENLPSLGSRVVDRDGTSVGQVADVFGPVNSPYVSVRLVEGAKGRLKSGLHELFLLESERFRRNRREKRDRH